MDDPTDRRRSSQTELETQERLTFTFHCADEDGEWLGLRGPVLLEPKAVMECVAALMAGVPGCCEVTVWVEQDWVLTASSEVSEPLTSR